MAGPGVLMSLGGLCVCIGAGRAGSGIGLKALRLLMMWFPTSVLRPKARQSTTVILSGGWRCSFSGNSYRTVTECRFLSCTQVVFFTNSVNAEIGQYFLITADSVYRPPVTSRQFILVNTFNNREKTQAVLSWSLAPG